MVAAKEVVMAQETREKRVLAVLEGTWGGISQEDAKGFLEQTMAALKRHGLKAGVNVSIAFAETLAELQAQLHRGGPWDLVVFNSRGVLDEAKRLQRQFPRIQMVLLTGLVPDGELMILPKSFIGDGVNPLLNLVRW